MEKSLAELQSKVTSMIVGLDARRTQYTPAGEPGRWTIQEIVEHLLLSYRQTTSTVERTLQRRRLPAMKKATAAQRIGRFQLLTLRMFPSGLEASAEEAPSLPSRLRTGEELGRQVSDELERMDDMLNHAERAFGSRAQVAPSVVGPLSPKQWRRYHLVHGLHHVRQISAIRRTHAA